MRIFSVSYIKRNINWMFSKCKQNRDIEQLMIKMVTIDRTLDEIICKNKQRCIILKITEGGFVIFYCFNIFSKQKDSFSKGFCA